VHGDMHQAVYGVKRGAGSRSDREMLPTLRYTPISCNTSGDRDKLSH